MTRILLAGATGLVGSELLPLLASAEGQDVLHLLVRRPLAALPDNATEHVLPTAEWEGAVAAINPDILISTLGTTIGKAGSEAAFRAVDQDLVLALATAAKRSGARHMIVISAIGADSGSRNFYLRVKGEVEDSLRALNFERLDILQPGLLTGNRTNDPRTMERAAILLSPFTDMLMHGPLRRYRSSSATNVAAAAAHLAYAGGQGAFIHRYDDIGRFAR